MSTKVVYIAGAGRSGSTFLSQLLSQNDDCFNLGQIRHLPLALKRNVTCACHQPIQECAYWGPVAAEMTGRHGEDVFERLKTGAPAFKTSATQNSGWEDTAVRDLIRQENAEYLTLLGDLYATAARQAGGAALIDSSKAPEVLLSLSLIPEISLYTLNLLRDPRAVNASWAKRVQKKETLQQRARNWNNRVRRMTAFHQGSDAPFLQLHYEDLASTPRQTIEDIQTWAGLQVGTAFFTSDTEADISWERNHLFPPANEEVLEKRATHIQIKPSESWKSEENAPYRKMAERINFPLAKKMGYTK